LCMGLLARSVVKTAKEQFEAVTVAVAERMEATASVLRAAVPLNIPRLLVATRGGNPKLMKFATSYAKDKGAALFVLYVREVALAFRERGEKIGTEEMTLENDAEAKKI